MMMWSRYATPFGNGAVVCRNDRIRCIVLPPVGGRMLEAMVREEEPEAREAVRPDAFVRKAVGELERYFAEGETPGDLLSLIEWPEVPAFTRRILEACAGIPRGEVTGYGELAERAGYAGSKYGRAVGNVMATNRLPLVIPCHRVVTSDLRLGNYGGGLAMKQLLLEREGALASVRL